MREIVHLQAGQCGNQIGSKFWEVSSGYSLVVWWRGGAEGERRQQLVYSWIHGGGWGCQWRGSRYNTGEGLGDRFVSGIEQWNALANWVEVLLKGGRFRCKYIIVGGGFLRLITTLWSPEWQVVENVLSSSSCVAWVTCRRSFFVDCISFFIMVRQKIFHD